MKIKIDDTDTPETIEIKMKHVGSVLESILIAWDKHIGPSSNGRTLDSESGNEGSTPSRPAKPVKHIIKEGARYHVISYVGGYNGYDKPLEVVRKCSEPTCEINFNRL